MKQKVTLTEKQLKSMIMNAILSEGMDENWWSRNYSLSSTGRGSAQLDDAKKRIADAQKYFSAPDKDSLENGFNSLGDAANFLMRAKENGLPAELMNPVVQTYLQTIQTGYDTINNTFTQDQAQAGAQAGQGAAQTASKAGAQSGAIAQDWPTAEKEINAVVKGDFSNWPQKCAQAGWPQEKITAYLQLANANKAKQQQKQQSQQQTAAAPAAQAATAAPQTGAVQESLEEAVSKILDKYIK